MATIQDIRAFELRICEAVEEYLSAPDAYDNPVLHVYLDKDRMEYRAEIAENISDSEDDGVYAVEYHPRNERWLGGRQRPRERDSEQLDIPRLILADSLQLTSINP